MKITQSPSPNFDSRGGAPIDMLVLHYTGMKTGQAALERLCDPASKVSAHYLIEENGDIYQLVDEDMRAWHAGVASWRGQRNINARSIGIELVNPGHEFGYRPFPAPQMQALAGLCQAILARHSIPARNIVAHSDVAPARKKDPGELFDWQWLAENSIGLFPPFKESPAKSQRKLPAQFIAAEGSENLAETLKTYGYGVESATPEQIITAFQRHFRPQDVNGQWDDDCQQRLEWLLENP